MRWRGRDDSDDRVDRGCMDDRAERGRGMRSGRGWERAENW